MVEDTFPTFEDDRLREDFERANALAADAGMLAAWSELVRDPRLLVRAREDPASYLQGWGVEVPDSLEVTVLDRLRPGRPVPDVESFVVRLINCRTVWVRDEDEPRLRDVEICLGFEIVPRVFPGGPIA